MREYETKSKKGNPSDQASISGNNASMIKKEAAQLQHIADDHIEKTHPVQKKANNTGLPDKLKSGIENLSGYSMDDVKVHRNSSKPAQLQAHAYAQGNQIHLASGQEKHLPHEAWHVVQQKQGRVKPTLQMKGKVAINDDAGLEKEADVMGAKALQHHEYSENTSASTQLMSDASQDAPLQLMTAIEAHSLLQNRFAIRSAYTADNLDGASFALVPTNYEVFSNAETSTTTFYDQIRASCQFIVDRATDDGYFLLLKNKSPGMGGGYPDSGTLDKYNSAIGSEVLLAIKIKGHSADSLFQTVIGNITMIKNLTPDSVQEQDDLDIPGLRQMSPEEIIESEMREIEERGRGIQEIEAGMEDINRLSRIQALLIGGGALEEGDLLFLQRIREELGR